MCSSDLRRLAFYSRQMISVQCWKCSSIKDFRSHRCSLATHSITFTVKMLLHLGLWAEAGGPDSWPGVSSLLLPSSLKVQPTYSSQPAVLALGSRRQGSWAPRRRGRMEEPSPADLDANNPQKTPKYKTDLEGRPVLFKET